MRNSRVEGGYVRISINFRSVPIPTYSYGSVTATMWSMTANSRSGGRCAAAAVDTGETCKPKETVEKTRGDEDHHGRVGRGAQQMTFAETFSAPAMIAAGQQEGSRRTFARYLPRLAPSLTRGNAPAANQRRLGESSPEWLVRKARPVVLPFMAIQRRAIGLGAGRTEAASGTTSPSPIAMWRRYSSESCASRVERRAHPFGREAALVEPQPAQTLAS